MPVANRKVSFTFLCFGTGIFTAFQVIILYIAGIRGERRQPWLNSLPTDVKLLWHHLRLTYGSTTLSKTCLSKILVSVGLQTIRVNTRDLQPV